MCNPSNVYLVKRALGKTGNLKLPSSILTFNTSSALDCPSDSLGLCKHSKICYAKSTETRYIKTYEFHKFQQYVWNLITVEEFVEGLISCINSKKEKVEYLRFNVFGDVTSQEDINKILNICELLEDMKIERPEVDLIVYLYTKRKDLDWKFALNQKNLVINGSEFMLDNNFQVVGEIMVDSKYKKNKHWVCNGDCRLCKACMDKGKKHIQVIKH